MNRAARRRRAGAARRGGGDVDGLLVRGTRRHQAGHLAEAEALYRRALAAQPDHIDARHYLGLALHQSGRTAEALPHLLAAAEARPGEAAFRHNLAEALVAAGRAADAIEHYRVAARSAPGFADIHYGLAEALRATGDAAAAETAYRAALRLSPGDAGARAGLAVALDIQGRTAEAIAEMSAAVEAGAEPVGAYVRLADMCLRLGYWAAAEDHARRALAAEAHAPEALEVLARVLSTTPEGDLEEARRLAEGAVEAAPELVQAHVTLGLVHQAAGRPAPAEKAFRRAIALEPTNGIAWHRLATMPHLAGPPVEEADLRAALDSPDPGDHDRAYLEFALGRQCERGERFDDAFTYYAAANRRRAAAEPFDAETYLAAVDRIVATFTADFLAARRGWGVEDPRPLFVVGVPRSGTSLVEQILASHRQVHGGGEREDMRRLVALLPERAARPELRYPEAAAALDETAVRAIAAEHLAALDALAPGAVRVTDKTPNNFLRLGLIALLFPGARVVNCRRDPRDTAVSCFVQDFGGGQAFSFDLASIGTYMRGYRTLTAHWERVLPIPMMTVDYEALVAEPEAQSRALVDFAGLPWDDACLRPHEADRAVRTASAWQVRQPVYASSVGRWKRYAGRLGPFLAALEEPRR